jgi:8-oxo-dGTP diphosphatase
MVVGFLFSPDLNEVVLLRKTHPQWQAGLLNGLGGHVKAGESPQDAMAREFHEESGLDFPADIWKEYARLKGKNEDEDPERWILHVFCGRHPRHFEAGSKTDEAIVIHKTGVGAQDVVPNVRWLLPMAIDVMTTKFSYEVHARAVGAL